MKGWFDEWDGVPRVSAWVDSAVPNGPLRQQARDWLASLPMTSTAYNADAALTAPRNSQDRSPQ